MSFQDADAQYRALRQREAKDSIAEAVFHSNRSQEAALSGYQTAEQQQMRADQAAYDARMAQTKAAEDKLWEEKEAARLKAREEEAAKDRAAAQQQAEAALKAEMRRRFFGSPLATDQDFEAAYPEMRRNYLVEQAMGQGGERERELSVLRSRYDLSL